MAEGALSFYARSMARSCVASAAAILLFALAIACFGQSQTLHLQEGTSLTSKIVPGEKLLFELNMPKGRFREVEISQQAGLDLSISLYDSRRKLIAKVGSQGSALKIDRPLSLRDWLETISLPFITETTGSFKVEVDSHMSDVSGLFTITINDIGPTSEVNRKLVEAARLFEEAEQLRSWFHDTSDLERALESYQRALIGFREIKNVHGEADCLTNIGIVYSWLKEFGKAVESFENAYTVLKSTSDFVRSAAALCYLAGTFQEQGLNEKAADEFKLALQIVRDSGDEKLEAGLLSRYGSALGKLENDDVGRQRVVILLQQSVQMFHDFAAPAEEAIARLNLAVYYTYIGQDQNAMVSYRSALALLRPLGCRSLIAFSLLRIGEIYFDRGDYQRAYDFYGEAYEYSRGRGDYYEAYTLYNLGNSSLTLDKRKVFEYLTRALPMWAQNRNGEAYTLTSIGRFYFSEGELQKALETYTKAIPIMDDSGDKYGVGIILSLIGETYFALGDGKRAIEFYSKALDLHRSTRDPRDEARTLVKLGNVYDSTVDIEKALSNYKNALNIFSEIGNRSGEANAHYEIAKAERQQGNVVEARAQIEQTLRIVESMRSDIADTEMRSAYFSSIQQYYEFYVDILMSLHETRPNDGFDRQALEAAEKGRARMMLELLASSQVDLTEGTDKALLEKEAELRRQIDSKAVEQVKLLAQSHTDEQAAKIERQIDDLSAAIESLRGRINEASPRFAAISRTQTLRSTDIQNLLDDDTLLLEYKLGLQRSFLWVVSPESIKTFILPKRSDLENLAREVYQQLTARNLKIKGETEQQASARLKDADERLGKSSEKLSKLLFGQVAPLLGDKRLVIVSDGAVQYIPFGSLPSPVQATGKTTNELSSEPLLAAHEMIYLPSASTLQVLRRDTSGRPAAERMLAVLADPVFSANDPRVHPQFGKNSRDKLRQKPAIGFSTLRALTGLDLDNERGIPRLPFSRREAEMITGLVPASRSLNALDFAASRTTATSADLSKYRIVHFATHGLLNSAHPELSGLLFSLVDERGEPENGFLPLQEIYHMKLNADLVVLSACQTALGKEVSGEGLIGLTQGFMYAGSPRVVASLWKVDDAATAELMEQFYKAMLQENQGPAAALRQAQLKMLKTKNWQHPYYWSAFTIQGEWK